MGNRVKGKVAIVTGGGSIGPGIGNGKASAIVYAREGADVMVVDYNLQAAEETRRLIQEEGRDCILFQADVSRADDCMVMAEECIKRFGKIDILHNNVGISIPGGMAETSEEIWNKVLNTNLKSMFMTCKFVLPAMEKRGSGCVINIASVRAIRAAPVIDVAYAVSKAGVVALTREIACEYALKGIRANAILPGLMDTPMVAATVSRTSNFYGGDMEETRKHRDSLCPTGKQGEAWDTAYAALFLASDEAKYITGAALLVDGGLTTICP